MKNAKRTTFVNLAPLALAVSALTSTALAETQQYRLEEVVITATKRADGQLAQDSSLSVTALSGDSIENRFMFDLTDVSRLTPNVQMHPNGTAPGTASFSMRGMGIFSSVPSDEPAVGIIKDGIYLGVNAGSLNRLFDVDSIEILRGPQGTLFGRNVTGGAVVINSRRPTVETEGKVALNVGNEGYRQVDGTLSGSLTESGTVLGRITGGYQTNDDYFDNISGPDQGEADNYYIKPMLTLVPSDDLSITLIGEYMDFEGDGVVMKARNQPNNLQLKDFQTSTDFVPKTTYEVKSLIADMDWDIGPGNARIIAGWRDTYNEGGIDGDGTATHVFHSNHPWVTDQDQISLEARYAMPVGERVELTTGIYYFEQEIDYAESRSLGGGAVLTGFGGHIDHQSYAVFAQGEIALTDALSLTLGTRYSGEKKDAKIASQGAGGCDLSGRNCTYDFTDSETWDFISGHAALTWRFNEAALAYASWSRSVRSGGFFVRNTLPASPGPYDEEQVNAYEIGLKADWLDGRLRTNIAAFYNKFDDLQFVIARADPVFTNLQELANAAGSRYQGVELELSALVTDQFRIDASAGYLDAEFTSSSPDSVVDFTTVHVPRAPRKTANLTLAYDYPLTNGGMLEFIGSATYTDVQWPLIQERLEISARTITDVAAAYVFPGQAMKLSAYVKNLTDKEYPIHGAPVGPFDVDLGFGLPRTYGVEMRYSF